MIPILRAPLDATPVLPPISSHCGREASAMGSRIARCKLLVGAASVAVLLVSSFTPALAVDSGICIAKFGAKCGELTMRGGKAVNYRYGSCKGNGVGIASYTAKASQNGSLILIDAATFAVSKKSTNSMSGKWTLRGRSQNITFNCG